MKRTHGCDHDREQCRICDALQNPLFRVPRFNNDEFTDAVEHGCIIVMTEFISTINVILIPIINTALEFPMMQINSFFEASRENEIPRQQDEATSSH